MKKDARTYECFEDGRMKRWTNAKREKTNYTFYIGVQTKYGRILVFPSIHRIDIIKTGEHIKEIHESKSITVIRCAWCEN